MNFDVVNQVITFSQGHPYLSFLMFSLVWFYAVAKTFQAFVEADEKMVLIQKHIVEMYLALDKAAGVDPISADEAQSIIKHAGNTRGGYVLLFGLGILLPITVFAFLTESKLLITAVILGDIGICFAVYRAIKLGKERQKLLQQRIEAAVPNA